MWPFKKKEKILLKPKYRQFYIYCEPRTAVASSPKHIRYTSTEGPKYSGNIDTHSLCRKVTPEENGWDLPGAVSLSGVGVCEACFKRYCELSEAWNNGEV